MKWLWNACCVIYYQIIFIIALLTRNLEDLVKSEEEGNNNDVNSDLIHDELFNAQYGTLKLELLAYRKAQGIAQFGLKFDTTEIKTSVAQQREATNETQRKSDPLKAKGDVYETFIGKMFEEKGDLVIYNGFIKGFRDGGVDIIVISPTKKMVNLVQCKNWQQKPLSCAEMENIYAKLNFYNVGFYRDISCEDINFYLEKVIAHRDILTILHDSMNYQVMKTLYLANDKIVDLAIGQHLTMMAPNIFKYKDMKMVIKGCV